MAFFVAIVVLFFITPKFIFFFLLYRAKYIVEPNK